MQEAENFYLKPKVLEKNKCNKEIVILPDLQLIPKSQIAGIAQARYNVSMVI